MLSSGETQPPRCPAAYYTLNLIRWNEWSPAELFSVLHTVLFIYLFVYDVFNDAVSITGFEASKIG
jgi:hypothetical protein